MGIDFFFNIISFVSQRICIGNTILYIYKPFKNAKKNYHFHTDCLHTTMKLIYLSVSLKKHLKHAPILQKNVIIKPPCEVKGAKSGPPQTHGFAQPAAYMHVCASLSHIHTHCLYLPTLRKTKYFRGTTFYKRFNLPTVP